jgi:hypothetical protein
MNYNEDNSGILSKEHLSELRNAKQNLENPTIAIQVTNLIGKPIEIGIEKLPDKIREPLNAAVNKSVEKALHYVTFTFNNDLKVTPTGYKTATAVTGFFGGFFGLPGLSVELPVTTMIMLRSILETALKNGEDINDLETRLSCIQVFAFGGPGAEDDSAESGYYAVRIGLAKAVNEAAKYITERGLIEEGAPIIVKLITNITARYGIVVSEKVLAQALPIIGGLAGAAINTMFTDHFQKIAEGHFTVRRLERIYSPELVKSAYESL